MTKLYYNCPVQAMYMLRYHDVKIQGNGDCEITVELIANCSMLVGNYWYIAPESYYIFEPVDGDIIECNDEYLKSRNYNCCGFQNYLSNHNRPEGKIIQRNNKPFIMPIMEYN